MMKRWYTREPWVQEWPSARRLQLGPCRHLEASVSNQKPHSSSAACSAEVCACLRVRVCVRVCVYVCVRMCMYVRESEGAFSQAAGRVAGATSQTGAREHGALLGGLQLAVI